jgi:hypothetical protein
MSSEPSGTKRLGRWSQIAEIIASFAVVATLLFLVAEVRQNTQVTRAAAFERGMEAVNEWRFKLASDPELARLYRTYAREGPGQGELEDYRVRILLNVLWSAYENAYLANKRGLLGAEEWSRFEAMSCVAYSRDLEWWHGESPLRRLLTNEFADWVEARCADGG